MPINKTRPTTSTTSTTSTPSITPTPISNPITALILHPTHSNPPSTIQLDPTIQPEYTPQQLLNQIQLLKSQLDLISQTQNNPTIPAASNQPTQPNTPSFIISNSQTLPNQPNQTLSQKIAAANALITSNKHINPNPSPTPKPSSSSQSSNQTRAYTFHTSTTKFSAQSKKSRMLSKLRQHQITINFALATLDSDPLLQQYLTPDDIHSAYNNTSSKSSNPNKSQTITKYYKPSDLE